MAAHDAAKTEKMAINIVAMHMSSRAGTYFTKNLLQQRLYHLHEIHELEVDVSNAGPSPSTTVYAPSTVQSKLVSSNMYNDWQYPCYLPQGNKCMSTNYHRLEVRRYPSTLACVLWDSLTSSSKHIRTCLKLCTVFV